MSTSKNRRPSSLGRVDEWSGEKSGDFGASAGLGVGRAGGGVFGAVFSVFKYLVQSAIRLSCVRDSWSRGSAGKGLLVEEIG